ncbi:MAG: hypothetical protein AB1716_13025 [Planctomycetota bacterium]
MRKVLLGIMAAALLSGGCAPFKRTAIVGHGGAPQASQVFGDFGIQGNGNNYTIQRGSNVTELSIIGHNNLVTVEEGVMLRRVEMAGDNNTVSVPQNQLLVHVTRWGKNNQIVYRPTATAPTYAGVPYTPYVSPPLPPLEELPPMDETEPPAGREPPAEGGLPGEAEAMDQNPVDNTGE